MSEFRDLLSSIFECSPDNLDDNATPAVLENWDSLRHITAVTTLEEEYRIIFTTDEIVSIKSIKDFRNLLAEKGITT